MPRINKTPTNPHGLSIKQQAVIQDVVEDVKAGRGVNLAKSTQKYYTVKNKNVAQVVATQNLGNANFREAMLEEFKANKIAGKNGKVAVRLMEGLDAITFNPSGKEFIDYARRLSYIQEINKITGVYAPERKQVQTMSLSVDMSAEELDAKIGRLQKQLA